MTKEKTSNRIPFPVFVAGRVEMRSLPFKRSGGNKELRMDRERQPKERQDRLGKRRHCHFTVSKVDYYCGIRQFS